MNSAKLSNTKSTYKNSLTVNNLEKKLRKTISFTITSKEYSTQQQYFLKTIAKDMYTKNYKTLMREIGKELNKQKGIT